MAGSSHQSFENKIKKKKKDGMTELSFLFWQFKFVFFPKKKEHIYAIYESLSMLFVLKTFTFTIVKFVQYI